MRRARRRARSKSLHYLGGWRALIIFAVFLPSAAAAAALSSASAPIPPRRKPPQSITFSLPVMNAARHAVVAMVGDGKAGAVHTALLDHKGPAGFPAQQARWVAAALRLALSAARRFRGTVKHVRAPARRRLSRGRACR